MIAALLLSAAVAAADPCAPVEPAPGGRDPAAAAAYREVGDAERAAGSPETAADAYREALARDPEDGAARAALEALCRSGLGASAFDRGVALLDAGDRAGAAAAFREARGTALDGSAALLEGVARYELGEGAAAREALEAAARDPAHREAASYYLALLALREGDGAEAARRLDAAAASPGYAALAEALAPLARREGRLVLALAGDAAWDSNAQLAPTGTPLGTSSDGELGLAGSALFRPVGPSGPYLRAAGFVRQQVRFGDLDEAGASGAAGWQLGGPVRGLLAEYGYEARELGGAPFLGAHHLLAAGWTAAGALSLGATYQVRFESYDGALYQPFSGTLHRAEVYLRLPLGRFARLLVAYGLSRDATDAPQLSFWEHGPRAELRHDLAPRLRLALAAGLSWRGYDAFDPALGVTRSDTYLDGAAGLEWDVADRWTVRAGVAARDASSSAPGFGYLRVVPGVGLAFMTGLM